jgi:hypothetical protein
MGVDKTPTLRRGERALIVIEVKGPLSEKAAKEFDEALALLLEQHSRTRRAGLMTQEL